jgi:hypothetical protein
MVGVNIYPKENDLPLPFAPTNICPLGYLDGAVNVVRMREGERDPPQIYSNLLQGVNGIRGAKHLAHHICPTCLAP